MAIRALNSVIVANYETAANASWHAGACLARDTSNVGRVVLADRASGAIAGGFVGFSADDTARTDNTMILADPVGSNYIDGSGVFQSNNNGFYVAAKRAIGDFQAENVNGVTNLSAQSSGYEGPRRGVGVFNTPGGQFVTDQFTTAATSAAGTDGATATYAPGAYLTVAVDDSGKLVELANKAHGPVVGIVDKYDSAAGLLYFTQAYFERAI
jgi:bifunctional ADP-heptose synthase (sugar kinase/adenylyltransferase)